MAHLAWLSVSWQLILIMGILSLCSLATKTDMFLKKNKKLPGYLLMPIGMDLLVDRLLFSLREYDY